MTSWQAVNALKLNFLERAPPFVQGFINCFLDVSRQELFIPVLWRRVPCFSVAQVLHAAELVIVQSQRQILKTSTKRHEIKMGERAESRGERGGGMGGSTVLISLNQQFGK